MKKIMFLFFVFFIILGCVGKDAPIVDLIPSSFTGVPGNEISFDASLSDVGGSKSLQNCMFEVFDTNGEIIDVETSSLGDEDGETTFAKYKYIFTSPGTYKVKASISDAKLRVGEKEIEIIIESQFSPATILNLGFLTEYENRPLSISAVGLDVANVSSFQ